MAIRHPHARITPNLIALWAIYLLLNFMFYIYLVDTLFPDGAAWCWVHALSYLR